MPLSPTTIRSAGSAARPLADVEARLEAAQIPVVDADETAFQREARFSSASSCVSIENVEAEIVGESC